MTGLRGVFDHLEQGDVSGVVRHGKAAHVRTPTFRGQRDGAVVQYGAAADQDVAPAGAGIGDGATPVRVQMQACIVDLPPPRLTVLWGGCAGRQIQDGFEHRAIRMSARQMCPLVDD